MGRASRINPMGCRILTGFEDERNFSSGRVVVDDAVDITDDMVLAFFDGEEQPSPSSSSAGEDGDEDEETVENLEERKAFWENQHQLLHATITKSSPLESSIRSATKQAMKEAKLITGTICKCGILVDGCRNCMLRHVSDHLCAAGFDAAICKSKWRSSTHIPSGEHIYIDVMDNNSTSTKKKGEVIRVVIELNFRAEFEMARANNEYNQLSYRLPEVFVGKAERLRAVIKIMCGAAKKCMKENKMHMGPWRKQKYMEAKWFGMCERTSIYSSLKQAFPSCQSTAKPRTSLLSFDLVERLPTMHCTAVEVL